MPSCPNVGKAFHEAYLPMTLSPGKTKAMSLECFLLSPRLLRSFWECARNIPWHAWGSISPLPPSMSLWWFQKVSFSCGRSCPWSRENMLYFCSALESKHCLEACNWATIMTSMLASWSHLNNTQASLVPRTCIPKVTLAPRTHDATPGVPDQF